jgi:hypothetical protein
VCTPLSWKANLARAVYLKCSPRSRRSHAVKEDASRSGRGEGGLRLEQEITGMTNEEITGMANEAGRRTEWERDREKERRELSEKIMERKNTSRAFTQMTSFQVHCCCIDRRVIEAQTLETKS